MLKYLFGAAENLEAIQPIEVGKTFVIAVGPRTVRRWKKNTMWHVELSPVEVQVLKD